MSTIFFSLISDLFLPLQHLQPCCLYLYLCFLQWDTELLLSLLSSALLGVSSGRGNSDVSLIYMEKTERALCDWPSRLCERFLLSVWKGSAVCDWRGGGLCCYWGSGVRSSSSVALWAQGWRQGSQLRSVLMTMESCLSIFSLAVLVLHSSASKWPVFSCPDRQTTTGIKLSKVLM